MSLRTLGIVALSWACLTAAADGFAQQPDETTRAAVRSLAGEGDALMDKGDFEGALDKYHRASALIPAPTVRHREAMCLEKLGRWIEAVDIFRQVARMQLDANAPAAFREAVDQAAQLGTALEKRVPKLVIQLKGEDLQGAKVQVDSRELPSVVLGSAWPVDPGRHAIVAIKGARRAEAQVNVAESTTIPVELLLPSVEQPRPVSSSKVPSASSSPPPQSPMPQRGARQRSAGWASLALGGAGLVVGAVTGGLAMSKRSSLESDGLCKDNRCATAAENDVNAFNTMRTVSTVGFMVGAAGLAAGTVLLIAAPSAGATQQQAGVHGWLGVGMAGLSGRF